MPKFMYSIWVAAFIFVIVGCKDRGENQSASVVADSGSTTANESSTRELFAEFTCRDSKIQIFDDSTEGDKFVKSKFATNNDKMAIISQTYYESEGGIIIEKDYCTQLSYSGNPVGGVSAQFLAFLANNPTEEPNGIQIFVMGTFLFESLRDVTESMYPDTAFWRDDTSLIAVYKSEEDQRIEMINSYRFQNGVWAITPSTDSSILSNDELQ